MLRIEMTATSTRIEDAAHGAPALESHPDPIRRPIRSDRWAHADGRFLAFESYASNLVPGDTNGQPDVFVHDRQPIAPTLTVLGACPEPMMLSLHAATPQGGVAIALGAAGSFTLTSSVCAGTILDLANPQLGAVISASWLGTIERTFPTTPAMCGRTVQALDIQTCKTSNTVVL